MNVLFRRPSFAGPPNAPLISRSRAPRRPDPAPPVVSRRRQTRVPRQGRRVVGAAKSRGHPGDQRQLGRRKRTFAAQGTPPARSRHHLQLWPWGGGRAVSQRSNRLAPKPGKTLAGWMTTIARRQDAQGVWGKLLHRANLRHVSRAITGLLHGKSTRFFVPAASRLVYHGSPGTGIPSNAPGCPPDQG